MISKMVKLEVFKGVAEVVDKYAYSRPSNIVYPSCDDLSQEGKLAAWSVIQRWDNDNEEHMRRSSITRGIGAMKDALRNANLVGPVIHNGIENIAPTSLDAERSESHGEDASVNLYDMLPCLEETPAESVMSVEMRRMRIDLLDVIDTLGEPWRYVILSRYYKKERQRAVANTLGISGTRVCQLEEQAIENLRVAVKKANLKWLI